MKKGGESWHKETVSFLFFFVNKWMGKIHQKFNPHGKYWGKEINPQTWHKISLTHGNPEEITVLKQGIKSSLDTGIYTEKDYPALHNSGRLLILHTTISRAPWWKLRPCVLFVSFMRKLKIYGALRKSYRFPEKSLLIAKRASFNWSPASLLSNIPMIKPWGLNCADI